MRKRVRSGWPSCQARNEANCPQSNGQTPLTSSILFRQRASYYCILTTGDTEGLPRQCPLCRRPQSTTIRRHHSTPSTLPGHHRRHRRYQATIDAIDATRPTIDAIEAIDATTRRHPGHHRRHRSQPPHRRCLTDSYSRQDHPSPAQDQLSWPAFLQPLYRAHFLADLTWRQDEFATSSIHEELSCCSLAISPIKDGAPIGVTVTLFTAVITRHGSGQSTTLSTNFAGGISTVFNTVRILGTFLCITTGLCIAASLVASLIDGNDVVVNLFTDLL